MAARPILVKRTLPLRPRRLGTQRRQAKGSPRRPAAGAPCFSAHRSLDTDKQLATSYGDLLRSHENEHDRRARLEGLRRTLLDTFRLCYSELNPQRQRDWERIFNCQSEWIGYRAACCRDAIAVPIGCNHRLCPLCNAHRSAKYRERVGELFGRMQHPVFLTLTVANQAHITKHSFTKFRGQIRKLLAQHKVWIRGGIYAIETTYNRAHHTWHVHAHCLLDSAHALPVGRLHFIRFKRRIEFDWLRLTGGRGWRDRDFNYWFSRTCENQPTEWNRENRRVLDIRRVTDRRRAAVEVLKYITKVSDFCDLPSAVDEFLTAVKGARMLQTFGSWYGIKFESDVNLKSWAVLVCSCGENHWERCGRLFREEVFMDDAGKWRIRERPGG